jgi:hypothetical protein
MVHDLVVIKGQCASQYEYDLLVEFIERHHHAALGLQGRGNGSKQMNSGIFSSGFDRRGSNDGFDPDGGKIGLDFMTLHKDEEDSWNHPDVGGVTVVGGDIALDRSDALSQSRLKKGIYRLPPVHVSGVITEIRAGHQRFKYAPEFEIGLKVLHDYRQARYTDKRDVQRALGWYMSGLGAMYEENSEEAIGALENIWDSMGNAISEGIEAGADVIEGITDTLGGFLGALDGSSGSNISGTGSVGIGLPPAEDSWFLT